MKYGFPRPQLLDTVSSTNDYLRSFVEEGSPRVVVARCQTGGRGRHGRKWLSEKDRGIYISFLCYPELPARVADRLNVAAALAVALTLEQVCPPSASVGLKVPNDVLLNGRKISGILVETAALGDRLSWVIIGIGINLTQESFAFEADPAPTSFRMEGLPIPLRERMYDILSRNLTGILREAQGGVWSHIEEEFRSRVCFPERSAGSQQ